MKQTTVTADDILCAAKEHIATFGWQRSTYPLNGPSPCCIRAAIRRAAGKLHAMGTQAHLDAITRVSEAIYGRGAAGGINDYEHRKRTTQDAVIALLQKAIEMGPAPAPHRGKGWWPA